MKISIFATLILGLLLHTAVSAQTTSGIIPAPRSVESGSGSFAFTGDTKLVAMDDMGRRWASILSETLEKKLGYKLKVTKKAQKNAIVFLRQPADGTADELGSERYVLDIKTDGISIGGSAAG